MKKSNKVKEETAHKRMIPKIKKALGIDWDIGEISREELGLLAWILQGLCGRMSNKEDRLQWMNAINTDLGTRPKELMRTNPRKLAEYLEYFARF